MATSELTRQAIFNAVENLMRKKSLDDLQIGQISDVAGVSRNTLYYHFSDKYEILDALLKSRLIPIVEPLLTRERWAQSLEAAAAQLRQDPAFTIHALHTYGRVNLGTVLREIYEGFLCQQLQLSHPDLSAKEQGLIVRFYTHAIVGLLQDWINLGMKQDVGEAIAVITRAIHENIFQSRKK